jgi:hypothetical protein
VCNDTKVHVGAKVLRRQLLANRSNQLTRRPSQRMIRWCETNNVNVNHVYMMNCLLFDHVFDKVDELSEANGGRRNVTQRAQQLRLCRINHQPSTPNRIQFTQSTTRRTGIDSQTSATLTS